MKTYNVEQRTPEWEELRKGKITGTGLKKILGKNRNDYIYEILAERLVRLVKDNTEETPLDRGVRLEPEGIAMFEKSTGKKVEQIGFVVSDTNKYIANSPDGFIKSKGKYTEAIEIKCPNASTHLQYWLTNEIPKEYYPQIIQYFIVNSDLKTLYFVSYDPRIEKHPIHIQEVHRQDVEADIDEYEQKQIEFLKEVEKVYKKIK